jgi:PAS domain S-box-containing protein
MTAAGNHESIRTKLTRIIVLTCGAAVLAACVIFATYDIRFARHSQLQTLQTLAELTGANSRAALTFRDSKAGLAILRSFDAAKNISRAVLFTPDGKVLAEYDRHANGSFSPPKIGVEGARLTNRDLQAFSTVMLGGRPVGTIYLESSIGPMREREEGLAAMVFASLLVALIVAQLLGSRLQHVISDPILQLAQTAFTVAVEKNYSVRAPAKGGEEIGFLYEQFNGMLDGIQKRDSELESARAELEQRVAERTSYLNALVETSPLGIVTTDRAGRVRMCNSAFEELFQYSRDEIIGAELNGLIAPPQLIREVMDYTRRIVSGESIRATTQRRRKNGTLLDIEMYGVALLVSGEMVGELVLYHDISERKQAEQALREAKEMAESADRAKGNFLANMSHEIRTPMNGIIGMTQLALEADISNEVREYLDVVRSSADSLLTLLNDILDFSKIEAGKLEFESSPFALRETLEQTIKTFTPLARHKGLQLAWQVAPEVPEWLLGDSGRLRQVLVNLIGNAIKFTERGEVAVSAKVAQSGPDWTELHFTVRDTGIGIPRDKQALVFAAFTQADPSTTRKYGGTGLGLTIVQRLVTMMGGTINLESEPGKGSAFYFTVQLRLPGKEFTPPRLAKRVSANEPNGPAERRILLAEDNAASRQLATRLLEKRGCNVVTARNGRDFLAILEREQVDLILLDVQMPDIDGREAIRMIRQKEKSSGQRIPIIAVTAHAMKGDREICIAAGADGYISKPLQPEELFGAMEQCLAGRNGVAGSLPVVNPLEALERCQGDHKLFAEIIELFDQSSQSLLREIELYVERGDVAGLQRAAHALKGSVGVFGKGPAYHAVETLEAEARKENLAAVRVLFAPLRLAVQTLKDALAPFRHFRSAPAADVQSGKIVQEPVHENSDR